MIAEILVAHAVGDYLLQSHWQATYKTKRWFPALVHAVTYGIPFLFITQSWLAILVIVGTHAVIDRYRLARHLVWFKNQLGPASHRPTWEDARATGYPSDTPPWLAVWLMIIADNIVHVLINILAISYL